MAVPTPITVRRQVLDVEVEGTQADGLALQRRLPAVCADVLAPALESALARIDTGGADLYVERLEVSVSVTGLDRLEASLADAVPTAVADLLRRRPRSPTAGRSALGGAPESGVVELRTVAATVEDALVVFLRTGRLPWSLRLPAGMPLEQFAVGAWRESTSSGIPPSTVVRIAEVLASETARRRMLMQFTRAFVSRLLRAWSLVLAARVDEVLALLDENDASTTGRVDSPGEARFTRALWEAVLVAAVEGRQPAAGDLARTAWGNTLRVEREDDPLVLRLETRWPGLTSGSRATWDAPTGGTSGAASGAASGGASGVESGAVSGAVSGTAAGGVEVEGDQSRREVRASGRDDAAGDAAGGILVDNAGLVILHPFLPRFFTVLGVADGDELVDPSRALCLLHHLATGELTAPEHQLTLAKVLCDVPLDEPVEADVALTAAEAAEANALLGAAIRHWAALRGSAPDGLRGEFLSRPGMLTADLDGGWLLQVESRTSDILLDQLPWGISMVQLPWMSRLLLVDWR